MTTISRVWDAGLGRHRDPYSWELPPMLTRGGPPDQRARDERRAARDARIREHRAAGVRQR
jgi:hypothetical protein